MVRERMFDSCCNSAKSGEINNVVWSDCGFVFKILVMLAATHHTYLARILCIHPHVTP